MHKRLSIALCLLALVAVGCNKSTPAENPDAKLQGPSQAQMQNTNSKVGGGGGRPMTGQPGGTPR